MVHSFAAPHDVAALHTQHLTSRTIHLAHRPMASHSNTFSISDMGIRHTTQYPSSPAIYTSTDEATADNQDHIHKRKAATEVCCRVLSRAHKSALQLSGFLGSVAFFIFAAMIIVVLLVTAQLTLTPINTGFGEAHEEHVRFIKSRCEDTAISIMRVVTTLGSLWLSKPEILNPSTMSEADMCNVVDNSFANAAYLRGMMFASQSLGEMRLCYQTYNSTTDARTLVDIHTVNGSYAGGGYLVDAQTHRYHDPRTELFPVPPNSLNATEYFALNAGIRQLIDEGAAYRAGKLDNVSTFLMWEATGAKPTYIFYTYPVVGYDTEHAIATQTPDARDVLQGRLDLQHFFVTMTYSDATRAVLLDPRGLRDGETDPYLIAASWMPRVTNDTDVWAYRDISTFKYARVSDITDNIMLAGLKHVKMRDFRQDAFQKTKRFTYSGAAAIMTWGNYTTKDGLSLSYVLVDSAGPVRGRIEAEFVAIVCCAVFLAIAIPPVFATVLDALFGHPMRTVARSLTRAGELGNKKARRHIRDDARIVITEVDELVDAHNEAVDILRAVETYLPPALFGDGDGTESFNGSVSHTSGTLDASRNFASMSGSFFDSVASTVAHRCAPSSDIHLRQMRVSLVTLHPVTRSSDGAAPPAADDDKSDQPAACGLEALRMLDRETYNAPTPAFHSRWAVQDYAAVVLQAAEQRHGTVLRLAPELTVVCFGGMMEALTRGSADAAALAPTLEAKACATDALAAVQFAQDVRSRLQQLAARDSTNVPDVVAVVETSAYHVGMCRVVKLQQSLSVAVGASLASCFVTQPRGGRGGMLTSPATAQLLMHRLRFVPRCVLHVCSRPAGHAMYATEIVHQMLDGRADTQSWRAQCGLLLKALECLHASEYARALTYLQRVPAAARGDMSLMSGARLGAVMRAAADTGVASAQLYGTVQSTLLAHLVRYCEVHLRQPQRANTVLTPASYLDVLARCLRPLPTADGALCDFVSRSHAYSSSVHAPSMASINAGRTASVHSAVPRQPLNAVTGVNGQAWFMPTIPDSTSRSRPFQTNVLVMNATGGIAQADELALRPSCWSSFTVEQIRNFVAPHEFPYIVQPEDLIVNAANLRVTAVYEFMSYPTVATYGTIFSHQSSVSLFARRFFCVLCALACLELKGFAHPRMIPNHLVLFPSGMVKLKAFFGTAKELLQFFYVPSVHYQSPEEAAGECPTIVSNVYSAAVIVLEFLARRLPYRWTAAAAADRVEDELTALQEHCGPEFAAALAGGLIEVVDIPAEVDMPESMRHILHLCLQRDPALRPRPRDVLRLYRADPYLGPLVRDFPSGP